jgi:thymidylate kinase
MDTEEISKITAMHTDDRYMNPDVGIILSIDDVEVSNKRVLERGPLEKPDTFESKGNDFHQRVSDGYLAVAELYKLPVISAAQSIEEVAEEINSLVSAEN